MTDVYPIGELAQFCESPIEVRLVEALAAAFTGLEEAGMLLDGLAPCAYEAYRNISAGIASAYLIPQAEIEGADLTDDWRIRVDFLLVCGRSRSFRKVFAIECDGHEWHEKTKEQVARDKLRDRRLVLDGITPIRFSGSEIHRDADACARYIRSLAHAALGDVLWTEYQSDMAKKAKAKKRSRLKQ